MPMKRKVPSVFIPMFAWIGILGSGLYLPLAVLQNIGLHLMFARGLLTDHAVTAYNPLEVAFYSNLRLFGALLLGYNLLFFISSIALLKRRNWARICLSMLMALALLVVVTVGAAVFGFDYEITAWNEPEKNRRFVRMAVGLAGCVILLLSWLLYKLNSRKIAEKLF